MKLKSHDALVRGIERAARHYQLLRVHFEAFQGHAKGLTDLKMLDASVAAVGDIAEDAFEVSALGHRIRFAFRRMDHEGVIDATDISGETPRQLFEVTFNGDGETNIEPNNPAFGPHHVGQGAADDSID